VQRGTIPLVKTTKEERLTENISVYDFELTSEEMEKIDKLDMDCRLYNPKFIKDFDWNNMPFYN
jgi:diketogulonate reductase-like aldo/keto reductase